MAARFVIGLYRCASLNRVFTPVTATTTIIPHVSDVRILCRNFSAEAEEEVKEVVKHVRQIVPVEVSMKYINSKAYVTAYGKDPVWKKYKRNFKGQWAPETRKTCIRGDKISGNPCPICRDEYLVLNYMNIELLKQFISPYDGGILSTMKTGLCQAKHQELVVAITKAKDYGLLSFDLPFRDYDYSVYQPK